MPHSEDERAFLLFNLQPGQRSLSGLGLLAGYYLFSILFGALLAAPLYWLVEWTASNILPTIQSWPWLHENCSQLTNCLLGKTLDNYFERARMAPILLGLPWIMWVCCLRSLKALGLNLARQNVRSALAWGITGAMLLGIVAAGQISFGGAAVQNPLPNIATSVVIAFVGALIIGLLEEIIFRGLVLRIFYTAFGGVWAVILSSAFYAYTHFKVPDTLVNAVAGDSRFATGIDVGFWTLFGIVKSFSAIEFLVLFGLGSAIGQVFLKTRNLLPGIGLHTGIVFTMLFYRTFFNVAHPDSFWGNTGFKDGWASLIVVAVLNLAIWLYDRPARRQKPAIQSKS